MVAAVSHHPRSCAATPALGRLKQKGPYVSVSYGAARGLAALADWGIVFHNPSELCFAKPTSPSQGRGGFILVVAAVSHRLRSCAATPALGRFEPKRPPCGEV